MTNSGSFVKLLSLVFVQLSPLKMRLFQTSPIGMSSLASSCFWPPAAGSAGWPGTQRSGHQLQSCAVVRVAPGPRAFGTCQGQGLRLPELASSTARGSPEARRSSFCTAYLRPRGSRDGQPCCPPTLGAASPASPWNPGASNLLGVIKT